METKKRLALFLDGSWNDTADNTNVRRLYDMVAARGADGLEQRSYYSTGVGTAWGQKVRGGIYGYGLDEDVRNAYRWLIRNYTNGDDIFLFGFSRGAFTARTLCGVIVKCGLLLPGAPLSVEQVWQRYTTQRETLEYWKIDRALKHPGEHPEDKPTEDDIRLRDCSRRVQIEMIGVWDTVGAMGIPLANFPIIGRSEFSFHDTNPTKLMHNGYHAMAIDEHRKPFDVTMWNRFVPDKADAPGTRHLPDPNIEQRWFVGAHSNVGGGIANSYLAQIPLDWIQKKAIGHGLSFKNVVKLNGDEHLKSIHQSLKWYFKILQLGKGFDRIVRPDDRKVGSKNGPGTVTPINVTIDATVFDRWRKDEHYRPKSIAQWAAKLNIDPAALMTSIRGDNGAPV